MSSDKDYEEKLNKKIEDLFDKYDDSKNGSLEKDELRLAMKDIILNLEPNTPLGQVTKIVDGTIKMFDDNNDDTIDLAEFTKIVRFMVEEKGLDLHV